MPEVPGDIYDHPNAPSVTVNEPSDCQATHTVTYGLDNTCTGWDAWYAIDGGSHVVYASGSWTNIYVLESANVPAEDIPVIAGQVYDSPHKDGFVVNEPSNCLVTLPHNAVIDVENGCPGWTASFSSSDGGVGTPTTPTFGLWVDPYSLENATVSYNVVWPDGFSMVVSTTVYEPETCLKHEVAGVQFVKKGCGPNGSTFTFTFPQVGVEKVVLTKGTHIITLTGSGDVTLGGGTWNGQVFPADGYDIVPSGNALFSVTSTVCPACSWVPTGRTVWVNYMLQTDPLHAGFWGAEDGTKTGVCKISTFDGNPPTLADQLRLCGCGMPASFVWHTTSQEKLIEMKNTCTGEIRLWNGWEFVNPYGGYNPNQKFCTATDCPPRP